LVSEPVNVVNFQLSHPSLPVMKWLTPLIILCWISPALAETPTADVRDDSVLEAHRYAPFLRAEAGVTYYGALDRDLVGYTAGLEGGVRLWRADELVLTLHGTLAYDDFSNYYDAFGLEANTGIRMSSYNGYWSGGIGGRIGVARQFGADALVQEPTLNLGCDLSVGVPIGPVTVLGMWAISMQKVGIDGLGVRQAFTLGASFTF